MPEVRWGQSREGLHFFLLRWQRHCSPRWTPIRMIEKYERGGRPETRDWFNLERTVCYSVNERIDHEWLEQGIKVNLFRTCQSFLLL